MSDPVIFNEHVVAALLANANLSITDARGRIIWVNDNFCRLCGYSADELIGKNHAILSTGTHDKTFYQGLWETLSKGNTWQGELQDRKKNGKTYWDEITIVPIQEPSKPPEQYLALHNDISLRKDLIESLKKRAHRQGLLAVLGRSIAVGKHLQSILDQFISVLVSTLDMRVGMILEHKTADALLLRSACGLQQDIIGNTLIPTTNNDLFHLTHSSDEPVIIENLAQDKRFCRTDFLAHQNIHSGISLTLGDRDQPWGILALFSDSPLNLRSDDVFFVLSITSLLTEYLFLHETELRLKNEQERSRKYMDMANVMFIAIAPDEHVILANQKATQILGVPGNQIIGMNWFDHFVPEGNREILRGYFHQLIENRIPLSTGNSHTNPVLTRHGNSRMIKWSNTLIWDNDNNILCTLSAGEDITDQLRAEQEKEHLQQELQQAKKMEAIGHLASGIAHDFNNILASIIGYSDLALETAVVQNDSKLLNYITAVNNAGHRAKDIIAQLASFSKDGTGTLQATLLPSLLKSTLKMLRATLPASIRYEQHINMDMPAVLINAEQFNQLIMHLLLHVRNAMGLHNGEMIVTLDKAMLSDTACSGCNQTAAGEWVELGVRYSAPCPELSRLKQLPDQNRTDPACAELIQVQRMTHDAAGHFIMSPVDEQTCRIRLLFPVATQTEAPEPRQKTATTPGARIMIVDDENSVAAYLGELLGQCRYQTSIFTDPTEALNSFLTHPADYDLVLTDQTMPMLNGLELAQQMVAVRHDLPVILMSGHSEQSLAELGDRRAIRHLLKKPLETFELLEAIHRAMPADT